MGVCASVRPFVRKLELETVVIASKAVVYGAKCCRICRGCELGDAVARAPRRLRTSYPSLNLKAQRYAASRGVTDARLRTQHRSEPEVHDCLPETSAIAQFLPSVCLYGAKCGSECRCCQVR